MANINIKMAGGKKPVRMQRDVPSGGRHKPKPKHPSRKPVLPPKPRGSPPPFKSITKMKKPR